MYLTFDHDGLKLRLMSPKCLGQEKVSLFGGSAILVRSNLIWCSQLLYARRSSVLLLIKKVRDRYVGIRVRFHIMREGKLKNIGLIEKQKLFKIKRYVQESQLLEQMCLLNIHNPPEGLMFCYK